jgi:hypothetical protein
MGKMANLNEKNYLHEEGIQKKKNLAKFLK